MHCYITACLQEGVLCVAAVPQPQDHNKRYKYYFCCLDRISEGSMDHRRWLGSSMLHNPKLNKQKSVYKVTYQSKLKCIFRCSTGPPQVH